MPLAACNGCSLTCTFGAAPATFMVPPLSRVMTVNQPAATIMNNVPMMNVLPFGMCSSILNPAVAAAPAAPLGVLTPSACIPMIPAPWVAGNPTVQVGEMPLLRVSDKLFCAYGGVIAFGPPGQTTVMG